MTIREDELGLFVEQQGAFPPEQLPNVEQGTVFSRRFIGENWQYDISASPVLSDEDMKWQLTEDFEPVAFGVLAIIETREAGDEGGDTSDYEYITVHGPGLTLEQALNTARAFVEDQNPEDYGD